MRAEKYENYQETFDGHNSFSKTNPDATFMRMKEGVYSGQLKAGYGSKENLLTLEMGVSHLIKYGLFNKD